MDKDLSKHGLALSQNTGPLLTRADADRIALAIVHGENVEADDLAALMELIRTDPNYENIMEEARAKAKIDSIPDHIDQ